MADPVEIYDPITGKGRTFPAGYAAFQVDHNGWTTEPPKPKRSRKADPNPED